jgi:hypothetical protein
MPRPKNPQSAADLDTHIRRLKRQRKRLLELEDQHRGAVIRGCLHGQDADRIRAMLAPLIAPRDAHLFGIVNLTEGESQPADMSRSTTTKTPQTFLALD